jgi:hypothetical protein
MNTTVIMIIELLGASFLLFALGYTFARISGYDKFYDKMLFDDDKKLIIKNDDNDDNDIIHHVSI